MFALVYVLIPACGIAPAVTLAKVPVLGDTVRIWVGATLRPRWYAARLADYMGMEPAKSSDQGFTRVTSLVGLSAYYPRYFSAHFLGDIGDLSGRPVLDLYAQWWYRGAWVRFGQFELPLTDETIELPRLVRFIDSTITSCKLTPTGDYRDIGVEGRYFNRFLDASLALFNGNGRGQVKDNNRYKDVAFRLVATPFGYGPLALGAGAYFGADTLTTNTHFAPFRRYLFSARWTGNDYFLRADYAMGDDSMRGMSSFSVAAGFRYRWIQPKARFERFVSTQENLPINKLTLGLNAFSLSDQIKPMLDFTWTQNKIVKVDELKVEVQLQLSFW